MRAFISRPGRGWCRVGPIGAAACVCALAFPVAAADGLATSTPHHFARVTRTRAPHKKKVAPPQLPKVLPAGTTVKGTWAASATNYVSSGPTQYAYAAISYPIPAKTRPKAVWVPATGRNPDATHCGGSSASPKAAPGYLCIYDEGVASTPTIFDPSVSSGTGAGRFGTILAFAIAPDASVAAYGTWALTGN